MSLLGRRQPEVSSGEQSPPDRARRLRRAERKEARRAAAAEAELAARIARAQRRLAQATGPLPMASPRASSDPVSATSSGAPRTPGH